MTEDHRRKTVAVCDTQPITAEGLRNLLKPTPDLKFLESLSSLESATASMDASPPDIVIVDKGFGIRGVLNWIYDLKLADATPAVIVWGVSMTAVESLQLLKAGTKGILRKTAGLASLLICLRTVANGHSCVEECLFHDSVHSAGGPGSPLTPRERQVRELVEQNLKNKEIALELGICPGTVKIHLKHIFEKTGVRGRYGLAISGLKQRGIISIAS